MIKNKEIIKNIEEIFKIKLFSYEKQFLDTLIEAEKYHKKLFFIFGRQSNRSCSRSILLYILYKESKILEKTIINGTSQNNPTGLYDAIKLGGDKN